MLNNLSFIIMTVCKHADQNKITFQKVIYIPIISRVQCLLVGISRSGRAKFYVNIRLAGSNDLTLGGPYVNL